MTSAAVHYFSGTGNSYRVASIIEKKLVEAGYKVEVFRVRKDMAPPAGIYSMHVFAFPVYATDVPDVMARYMKNMRPGGGAKASIVAVYGDISPKANPLHHGYEGAALVHAAGILKKKGYEIYLTDAVGYPANVTFVLNPPSDKDQEAIRKISDRKTAVIAERVAGLKHSIKPISLFNHVWTRAFGALYANFGAPFLGKMYVADSSCSSCGKCVRSCPARAIALVNKRPRWNWKCMGCQRCINSCPESAIQTSVMRLLWIAVLYVVSIVSLWWVMIIPYDSYAGPVIAGVLWLAGNLLFYYLSEIVVFVCERLPVIGKLFELTFTKGYRRYLDPGFDPVERTKHGKMG